MPSELTVSMTLLAGRDHAWPEAACAGTAAVQLGRFAWCACAMGPAMLLVANLGRCELGLSAMAVSLRCWQGRAAAWLVRLPQWAVSLHCTARMAHTAYGVHMPLWR